MYNSGEEDDLLRDENDFSDDEGDTDDEDNIPINFTNALILNGVILILHEFQFFKGIFVLWIYPISKKEFLHRITKRKINLRTFSLQFSAIPR